jgi:hypothetical protein
MMSRGVLIATLTQTIAPRLFSLSGDKPEEMGFPTGNSKEHFEERLARQFDPVTYWTEQARVIATSLVNIIEAGGVDVASFDYDKALDVIRSERPDLDEVA